MSATERARSLTEVLELNDEVLMAALSDMPEAEAKQQLRTKGPSIAWNVGHMLQHRNLIAKAIGCAAPAIDVAPYEDDATDGQNYPGIRELQKAWTEFSARFRSAVRAASADTLQGPSPMRNLPHEHNKTLLDAFRFIVWHEGLHLGQISLLRSQYGLLPTVDVLRAAVTARA